jgi:hypothetical protein
MFAFEGKADSDQPLPGANPTLGRAEDAVMVQKTASKVMMVRVYTANEKKIVVGNDDDPRLWKALLSYFKKNTNAERLVARSMPAFKVYTKVTKGETKEKIMVQQDKAPKLWKALLTYFEETPEAQRLVARRKLRALR